MIMLRRGQALRRFIPAGLMVLMALGAAAVLSGQEAVFESVKGKVEYRDAGGSDWTPAAEGDAVPLGGSISTGFNSEAVIALGSDSVVTAKPLTRLTLEELLIQEDAVDTDLFLDVGGLRAEVNSSEGVEHDFTIRSTQSTASVRGTVIEGDGASWQTERGTLVVSSPTGQQVTVTRGQSTQVSKSGPPAAPQAAKEKASRVVTSAKPPRTDAPSNLPADVQEDMGSDILADILSSTTEVEITVVWP